MNACASTPARELIRQFSVEEVSVNLYHFSYKSCRLNAQIFKDGRIYASAVAHTQGIYKVREQAN